MLKVGRWVSIPFSGGVHWSHFSTQLLQEYGLDFRFMLDQLLVEKPRLASQSIPEFTFQDPPPIPTIEPAPPSRIRPRALPDQPSSSSSAKPNARPPALDIDSLAPPPSTAPMRSSLANGRHYQASAPLLSAPASGYSSASHYSGVSPSGPEGGPFGTSDFNNLAVPNRERVRTPVSASGGGGIAPLRTPHSAAIPSSLRPRTPGSAAPPSRARTPISAAPPSSRPRTPVSAAPPPPPSSPSPFRPRTPASVAEGESDRDGRHQATSPLPRRVRSPPPMTSPLRPGARERDRDHEKSMEEERDYDQPMRAVKNPVLPPRSVRRPGSREIVKPILPLREGMF